MESMTLMSSSSSLNYYCGFRPFRVERRRSTTAASAAGRRDRDCSGRVVDENMIVLRKRIHEMKVMERNYGEPPAEWMHWEKLCYSSYDSIICDLVRAVQSQLMDTRPCVALGIAALIAFSVPVSTVVVFSNLMDLALRILEASSPIITH